MKVNDKPQEKCPLCGIAMEDPEECQHCDFKRRDHGKQRASFE